MGSFTEVVLSFDFREDTPDDVLAAFSALEQPHPEAWLYSEPPALPVPVREPSQHWAPDWREEGPNATDEFEAEPWRHAWAAWLGGSSRVDTVPAASLTWHGRWTLTCRCTFKSWPEALHVALEWLGPYIDSWDDNELGLPRLHARRESRHATSVSPLVAAPPDADGGPERERNAVEPAGAAA